MQTPAFGASAAAAAPQTESGLRRPRLHLHDISGRQEQVGFLLGQVRRAFDDDRFVDALGAFREAINLSRGVPSLEEHVLARVIKEANDLAERNWRVAEALIHDAEHLDKDRQAFAATWKEIHASQAEERAARIVTQSVDLEIGGNRQLTAEAVVKRPEVAPPATVAAVAAPTGETAPSLSEKTGRSWSHTFSLRSLQVPLSVAATLVLVGVALWTIHRSSFEETSKPPDKRLSPTRSETTNDAAARRSTTRGGLTSNVSPAPVESRRAPVTRQTPVERTEVVVPVPARTLQPGQVSAPSSDELTLAAQVELEWQKVDQSNAASLQAFVSAYPDTSRGSEGREKLLDLDRIKRTQEEQAAWDEVDKNSRTGIQSFLAKYPAGNHQEKAISLMADLDRRADAARLEAAEESAWNSVRLTEQGSIENYLAQFPSGKNHSRAMEALADIRQAQKSKDAEAAVILNVIARLAKAWNTKDVDSIVALQANLDRRLLKSQLLAAKTLSITISPTSVPEITDAQATVKCRRETAEVFLDGVKKIEPETLVTYVLTKRNGAWIVEEAR